MIKRINDGELERLKKGFYRTLSIKKMNILDNNKFINMELDINKAITIYKCIVILKKSNFYTGSSTNMLDYLYIYNMLEEKDYDYICDFFKDYDIDEIEDEYYCECWDERNDFVNKFIKKLAEEKGIKVHSEYFSDIYSDCFDDEIYNDLRDFLREYGECYEEEEVSENDLRDDYYDVFQEDAISYILEGYEMTDYDLMLLNNTFFNIDIGITSEAYTRDGHTYITISNMQILEAIDYSFLIILKLIFMNI
ncbi:hypothetical protein HYH38_16005 [Clostridium botulinum]|uniref:Uncharacterized protein n=1 Tax=Clostridium botulinum TaxID=1491 RepID=A0A126JIE4_CLOBO|nr:hypothetical protein [Clostridium botulinum]ALT05468.1 hypothetical protein [Clostridium botulinum]ALT05566.1 hypothetical protein [Clostridium botulinum]MBY6810967.1 hypothetical protein [Clostridium botulinum]MBY6818444.1 hypothetical protein [Clostridium botulinum]MBY6824435.1 hypothetical protein [Clostridium botulinum]